MFEERRLEARGRASRYQGGKPNLLLRDFFGCGTVKTKTHLTLALFLLLAYYDDLDRTYGFEFVLMKWFEWVAD